MAEILKFKRPKATERHKGKGLCREGFHKWVVDKQSVFDVKQGRLVTRYRCKRCGKVRTTSE
jgi:hypothetical protein